MEVDAWSEDWSFIAALRTSCPLSTYSTSAAASSGRCAGDCICCGGGAPPHMPPNMPPRCCCCGGGVAMGGGGRSFCSPHLVDVTSAGGSVACGESEGYGAGDD